jgi:hypothetical protein
MMPIPPARRHPTQVGLSRLTAGPVRWYGLTDVCFILAV